jgi:predicted DNA-binding transcriptional regulator AlpA
MTTPSLRSLLTKKEIISYLNISNSSFYRLRQNNPNFPKPINVSSATVRYSSVDLDTFVDFCKKIH